MAINCLRNALLVLMTRDYQLPQPNPHTDTASHAPPVSHLIVFGKMDGRPVKATPEIDSRHASVGLVSGVRGLYLVFDARWVWNSFAGHGIDRNLHTRG